MHRLGKNCDHAVEGCVAWKTTRRMQGKNVRSNVSEKGALVIDKHSNETVWTNEMKRRRLIQPHQHALYA